jgi:hypothetical protein
MVRTIIPSVVLSPGESSSFYRVTHAVELMPVKRRRRLTSVITSIRRYLSAWVLVRALWSRIEAGLTLLAVGL